jgi:small conductance mechanosensitive channel
MEPNIDILTESFQDLLSEILRMIPDITIAILILVISMYLAGLGSRVLSRWLSQRDTDPELSLLLAKVTRWGILILGITMALNQVGFNLTAFLTGLGIVGFTVGFAIQDVSKNFVAGLLLLIEQPFDLGDSIQVAGFDGVILDVDLRATQMRTFDGRIVQIPNSDIFTSPIINYTKAVQRRLGLNIGVAYGSDLELVRSTALEAISSLPGLLADPAPRVVFGNFGGSSIDFTLYYWIDTSQMDYFGAQDGGIVLVNQAFAEAGIEIPFPIQTLYVQNTPQK